MDAYQIEDDKRKKALLIHQHILYFWNCKNLFTSKKIFDYFSPKKCIEYQMHKFRKCFQKETENIDKFHTRWLTLAENYEFANEDLKIEMKIFPKCKSDKLLSMTLKEILSLERSIEMFAIHAEEM